MLRKLVIVLCVCTTINTWAADEDVQQWSLLFANYQFDDRRAASFQIENRMRQDMSEFDILVLKPGVYHRFNKLLNLGIGYKYQIKDGPNEQDLWQELFITPGVWAGVTWTHQIRLEERFVGGINGTVPRLRYLLHGSRPFKSNPKRYLAFQNATRFNFTSRHEGPPDGFDQNRAYIGLGFEVSPSLRIEVGYLWRYQRERGADNLSDHALRLQFLFDTAARHPSHGGS